MGVRAKGRAKLATLREAFLQSASAADELSSRPVLLGIGRATNVEEEQSFEGRTMGVGLGGLPAIVLGDAQERAAAARRGPVFETAPGSNTDVVWYIPWKSRPITLGRNRENDVIVPEYSVSGEHCRFNWTDRAALDIEDREASNGVWVDGERLPVATPRRLQGREQVVLGRFVFCFLYTDDVRLLLRGGQLVDGPDGKLVMTDERAQPEPERERRGLLGRLFGRGR